jgi:hypothetical protein
MQAESLNQTAAMAKSILHKGFAIAIAWPELYCKQSLSWYDYPASLLGISKSNYYRAGHAALVLVDIAEKQCHYFYFGRYHAPFNHGRVRSAVSDHELEVKTRPEFSENGTVLTNFRDILEELQSNKACHGAGVLYASYTEIDFRKALEMAKKMQLSAIPYGPFKPRRSNCSRFVNRVILAGNPTSFQSFRLRFFVPLTPTPMNNVNSIGKYTSIPYLEPYNPLVIKNKHDRIYLQSTLSAPVKDRLIPHNAQWLAGEGAGSWFVFGIENGNIKVSRYSPEGIVECSGLYTVSGAEIIEDVLSANITYPSDCRLITMSFKNSTIVLSLEKKLI